MCSGLDVGDRTVQRNTARYDGVQPLQSLERARNWQEIVATATGSPEPPEQGALDSTHFKAHRCAGGGKGRPRIGRSVSPKVAGTARVL
jgi:hypothetical protein